jgi:selenoprotein W-related protein
MSQGRRPYQSVHDQPQGKAMENHPRVEIRYCTQCRWILRAGWLAQELLSTFDTDLGEVALVPGTGGIFEVRVDGELIWSRKEQGRFPEAKELKQRVRDRVAPDKDLGHSDRQPGAGPDPGGITA